MRLIKDILDILHVQKADATVIAPTGRRNHGSIVCSTICPLIRITNNHKAILAALGQTQSFQNKKWKLYAWIVSDERLKQKWEEKSVNLYKFY